MNTGMNVNMKTECQEFLSPKFTVFRLKPAQRENTSKPSKYQECGLYILPDFEFSWLFHQRAAFGKSTCKDKVKVSFIKQKHSGLGFKKIDCFFIYHCTRQSTSLLTHRPWILKKIKNIFKLRKKNWLKAMPKCSAPFTPPENILLVEEINSYLDVWSNSVLRVTTEKQ